MSSEKEIDTIPLSCWYIVGGTGPPPTRSAFLRMASERKAAHRAGVMAKEARREAVAKAHAENPVPSFVDMLKKKLGQGKSGKDSPSPPTREELMSKYGGKDKSLRRRRQVNGDDQANGTVAVSQDGSPGEDVPGAVVVGGDDAGDGKSQGNDTGGTEGPDVVADQVNSASGVDDAAVGSTGYDEPNGEEGPDVPLSDKSGPDGESVSPADTQEIGASTSTPGETPSSAEPVPGPSTRS